MRIVSIAAVLALSGCTVLGLSDDDDGVRIDLVEDRILVENRRSVPVFYAAIGENSLALFGPCVRPDCPR